MAAHWTSRCCRVLFSLNSHVLNSAFTNPASRFCRLNLMRCSTFHTSVKRPGLDEFFEDKKLWTESEITCGRPWKLDELRIKSNEDLHKLWYVLLKERNMLMTMEHEYKRACELFPSPERLDKVDESMKNLLSVVDERNEAYNLLETGKTGKPEIVEDRNILGLKVKRQTREHFIPPFMNKMHKALHPPYTKIRGKYIHLYAEKLRKDRHRAHAKEKRRIAELRKRFPHIDIEDPPKEGW
ncbi:large ribosomal subunit protein uL29m-like [Liolophura sinensis]|uniref:large ribosomal subunit protein uL29m-like n=1 Tax=Liolophura sinensis TaxID=3198878 RepID=UPI003158CFB7